MSYRLFLILALCFSPVYTLASEVMFEGYYRVDLERKQIGYIILRYAFEPKKKTFETVSFSRMKVGDKILQESWKGAADDQLHPLSYEYTSQIGEEIKMIDATFKGDIMTLKINDGKKVKTETYKNLKDTYLSSFLPYVLLRQPLALNAAFSYNGIAEEDGGSYGGKAWFSKKENKPGFDLYTVVNKYHGQEFYSQMALVKDPNDPKKFVKGEVFSTNSESQNISSTLVGSAALATEGQLVPNKTIVTLFGNMPTGKMNMVATPPAPVVATEESSPPKGK